RPTEAIKDWQRAVELDDQQHPLFRLGYAAAQARTGQAAPAVAVAEEQAQAPNVTGATLFDCARVLALAAAPTKEDAALPEPPAARAVALLRQAVQKGYKDLEQLKKDKDFDAVRSRDDFQKLLAEREGQ